VEIPSGEGLRALDYQTASASADRLVYASLEHVEN